MSIERRNDQNDSDDPKHQKNNQPQNTCEYFRTIAMDNIPLTIAGLVVGVFFAVCCVVGYIYALNPAHKYLALWWYFGAGCWATIGGLVALLSLCLNVQAKYRADDASSRQGDDGNSAPLVLTPSDFPLPATQQAAPLVSPSINNQAGQGNINAPGFSGNFNTGPINAPLTQTYNAAPPDREITQAQIDVFKNLMMSVPDKEHVAIMSAGMGGESSEYASKLFQMLVAADFKNISIGGLTPTQTDWVGVTIFVKDPNNLPPLFTPLANALTSAHIKFVPKYDPQLFGEPIHINVGKAESQ